MGLTGKCDIGCFAGSRGGVRVDGDLVLVAGSHISIPDSDNNNTSKILVRCEVVFIARERGTEIDKTVRVKHSEVMTWN